MNEGGQGMSQRDTVLFNKANRIRGQLQDINIRLENLVGREDDKPMKTEVAPASINEDIIAGSGLGAIMQTMNESINIAESVLNKLSKMEIFV